MTETRNSSLDTLRGIAVLLVISLHAEQTFPALSTQAKMFAGSYGRLGVQLFFIVSGFTMMLTFGKEISTQSVTAFYIRRFFRIAPMFWLAIAAYLAIDGTGPRYWAPSGVHLSEIALTAGFVQWISPTAFNSVVPGGWSISVEMLFYAIFPLLLFLLRRRSFFCYGAIICTFFVGKAVEHLFLAPYLRAAAPEENELIGTFFYFWLPTQIICFGFGIALFQIIEERQIPRVGLILLGSMAFLNAWTLSVGVLFFLAYFVLSLKLSFLPLCAIGRASYSMYLVHFGLITGVVAISPKVPFEVVIPIVTVLSFGLYRFVSGPLVETPFVKLGSRLALRTTRPSMPFL